MISGWEEDKQELLLSIMMNLSNPSLLKLIKKSLKNFRIHLRKKETSNYSISLILSDELE